MGPPTIDVVGLKKDFTDWRGRTTSALKGVSLTVHSGMIFGLLGRNGAGKTTLVKILLSLVHPTSGKVKVLGKDVNDANMRKRIGYLPEQIRLPEHLKAVSFLRYMGELNGVPSSVLDQRVPMLLEQVGLANDTKKFLSQYSKGMQQRLGLAQAMINDPDVLFLDEPTDGLDPMGRKQVRDWLVEMRNRGKTIFLNSHLLSEIELVCDQVVIIEKGVAVKSGSPHELTQVSGSVRFQVAVPEQQARAAQLMSDESGWSGNSFSFQPRDRVHLNAVIDTLRAAGIEIEAIEPMRKSLEERFIELVTESSGKESGMS